ncbi:MAG TPA: ComEC/Rec2 family competence protein [Candidatus Limnocylindrales bacterium]
MTSSLWLAIGAVAASLAGGSLQPGLLVLLASALAVGVAGLRTRGRGTGSAPRIATVGALLPLAVGCAAIAVRMATLAPPAAADLPADDGPWIAGVVAIGSPKDGQQLATLSVFKRDAEGAAALDAPVLVSATLPRFPAIEPGDRVRVSGRIEAPPDGPYGDYLSRIGVVGTLYSRALATVGRSDDPGARLEAVRRRAGDALAAAIPEPEAGLAAGIVIGLRDRVDRDLAAAFTTVGASHVVAISGWNIAIVAATVAALVGRLGRRRRSVVLISAILAYVLFAGASPSVVRAAAMAGVVLLARETGRAGRAAAALGWAAALLLVADPRLVLDPGFQLSTLATGGILAWASRWTDRIGGLAGGRVPRWLAESLGVSLAAQAATLPVVLLTFGRLALVSPAVNLLVVPLVAPAMGAALIAMLGGALALAGGPAIVATITGLPAWALLTAMCTVIRAAATLPFANVTLGAPWTLVAGAGTALLIVGGPAMWHRIRVRRRAARAAPSVAAAVRVAPARSAPARARSLSWRFAILAVVAAAIGLGLSLAHRPDGAARITVLDVGQGDAILVEGGRGGRMLVDGGPDPGRLLVELDRRLPPWDRRIDILVLTHPHEDHVAGMPLLLDRYRIGRIYETGMRGPGPGYRAFAKDLERPGAPPHGLLATGASIGLDGIRLHVLWPDPGRVPLEPPDAGRGINDVSVVLLGEVAGRRFLLTGDVEDDVDPLLATRGLPPVDILKVAHHGSATASTPAFLDAVHPRVAIVSAGAGNPYGHPARSTIERLQGTGAKVLRTDTDGTVSITIDPSGAIDVTASGPRRTSDAGGVRAASTGGIVLARAAVAAPPATAATAPPTILTTVRSPIAWACGIPSSG